MRQKFHSADIFALTMSLLIIALWIFWLIWILQYPWHLFTLFGHFFNFLCLFLIFIQGSWYSLGSSQPTLGLMAAHQFGISRSFVILRLEVKLPPCFQSKKMSQNVKPKIRIYTIFFVNVYFFLKNIIGSQSFVINRI